MSVRCSGTASDVQSSFWQLADGLQGLLLGREEFLCNYEGERSDFVRFNHNRVRQAGRVTEGSLHLDLIEGRRHTVGSCSLSGDEIEDRVRLSALVTTLRAARSHVDEDPYLLYATDCLDSIENGSQCALPDSGDAVEQILSAADGLDLVGVWAGGDIYRGFASSLGSRAWYSAASFNFDWSCYHAQDKAVKSSYSGTEWSVQRLHEKLDRQRTELELLARPARTIPPGRYRSYLAPSALREILALTSWGGYGLKSHRTLQTPLLKMVQDLRTLHPCVAIRENHAGARAPRFTNSGFLKQGCISLIEKGRYASCLVDPRSAKEFGVPVNDGEEQPEALDMQGGDIPACEVQQRLDTGLLVNDLWYLNFSDRNDCRITGMTRFACFWVQDGEVQAPVNVMRFDDSLYRMLGENLLGLTVERELMLDTGTYGGRSTNSFTLPGALLSELSLTL